MYQAKSGVKNFSLYWGGSPSAKSFFWSEHVSSQIWCQKFFPLPGGGPTAKIFFSSLNMYQAKSGVKNFSLYWGGGPSAKILFSGLNMYQAKSGVKNFSLYWIRTPSPLSKAGSGPSPPLSKAGLGPPPSKVGLGNPPPSKAGLGPPPKGWIWYPPTPKSEQTDISKYKYYLPSYYVRGR